MSSSVSIESITAIAESIAADKAQSAIVKGLDKSPRPFEAAISAVRREENSPDCVGKTLDAADKLRVEGIVEYSGWSNFGGVMTPNKIKLTSAGVLVRNMPQLRR